MKQLLVVALGLVIFFGNAQTSFSVAQQAPALAITPNSTVDITIGASGYNVRTMHIQNTSNATKVYNVKKYAVTLNATLTGTAEASFTFGGCDFPPQTAVGMCSLTLTSGQNSSTMGDYFSLDCKLEEANTAGYSLVKYTIYNTTQLNDSLQFTLRYNYVQQANALNDFQLAEVLCLQPNPAKDLLTLRLSVTTNNETSLQILDITGKQVLSQTCRLQAGENTLELNLENLNPGLYYLKLQNQTAVLSRKLVVE